MKKRILSFALVIVMIFPAFSFNASAVGKYGSMPIYIGNRAADYMADEILKQIPTAGKSATEKIRAVYDWIIKNCTRYENEWDGTYYFDESAIKTAADAHAAQVDAKVKRGDAVIRQDVGQLFNISGFFDSNGSVGYAALNMMKKRNGDCVNFTSLLTVLLDHLGYDSRVIAGDFINADGTRVMHKWSYVLVDGKYYWLDVRMDHANYVRTGRINYQYFMITDLARWERTHEWDHAYSNALGAGAASVTNLYNEVAVKNATAKTIKVVASRSGTSTSGGRIFDGDEVSVYAYQPMPEDGWQDVYEFDENGNWVLKSSNRKEFVGWYDEWGNLLTTEQSYTFTVTKNATLYALFEGDVFADITATAWYLDEAIEGYNRGLVKGVTAVTFGGNDKFTRAQVAEMLPRVQGDSTDGFALPPFTDVPDGKWFTKSVSWAYASGIVKGVTETSFAPSSQVTRQEFLTMVARWLEYKGYNITPEGELGYSDAADISDYAKKAVSVAQQIGLVTGYTDGTLKPKGVLNRAEGTTVLLRLLNYIEANPLTEQSENME